MRNPLFRSLLVSLQIFLLLVQTTGLSVAAKQVSYKVVMHIGEGQIENMQWSADGSKILFGTSGSTRLYSSTLKLLGTLPENSHRFSWNPNSNYVVYITYDGHDVMLWNIETNSVEKTIIHREDIIYSGITFSPNGKLITLLTDEAKLLIWDIQANSTVQTIKLWDTVDSISWNPTGTRILACRQYAVCYLIDPTTGTALNSLYFDGIDSVAWKPDGKQFALYGRFRTIRIVDAEKGSLLKTLEVRGSPDFAWSPDGTRFLTQLLGDKGVSLWDADTFNEIWRKEISAALVWSPDNKYLASVEVLRNKETFQFEGEQLVIIDVTTGNVDSQTNLNLALPQEPISDWVTRWSPDGTQLLLAETFKGDLLIYDMRTRTRLYSGMIGIMGISAPSFSPDGKTMAVRATRTGNVELWDTAKHQLIKILPSLTLSPENRYPIEWSPNGLHIIDVQLEYPDARFIRPRKVVRIWDTETGTSVILPDRLETSGQSSNANGKVSPEGAYWQPDGKRLAVLDSDMTLRVVDFPSFQTIWRYDNVASAPSWQPNGKALAIWDSNLTLHLLDAQSGKRLWAIQPYNGLLNFGADDLCSIQWNPDSTQFLCGAWGVFAIFDGKTGSKLVDLQDASGQNLESSWTRDGKRIFGVPIGDGGPDGDLGVWEASTGKLLDFPIHRCRPFDINPDGQRIVCRVEEPYRGGPNLVANIVTGEILSEPLPTWGHYFIWSPDGNQLAVFNQIIQILEAS
jgi:WD40 repeat protein